MKKLFAPYELAVLAKEKEFNEDCLAAYSFHSKEIIGIGVYTNNGQLLAPLYQQLVDWFREKHGINVEVKIYSRKFDVPNNEANMKFNITVIHPIKGDCVPRGKFIDYHQALTTALTEAFKLIMKKLELKHIAPYFPYRLKLTNYEKKYSFELLEISKSLDVKIIDTRVGWDGENHRCYNFYHCDTLQFKPILRPLSDFEKVIAKDLMTKFSINLQAVHEIWRLINKEITLDQISYSTYLSMCINHIDFNGLIEQDLAIDINTL